MVYYLQFLKLPYKVGAIFLTPKRQALRIRVRKPKLTRFMNGKPSVRK